MLLGSDALGELPLGDAPFSPFISPVFPRTAGDIIVCNSTVGGFGATDVTSQTFQYSIVNTFDPQRIFNDGAIFAFEAGIPMEDAPNPVCTLLFTRPDGTKFTIATPYVYIGVSNLPTYLGVLAGSTYVIYVLSLIHI